MKFTRTEIESTMSHLALEGISTDFNKRAPKIKVATADLRVLATSKVDSLLGEARVGNNLYSSLFDGLRTARRLEIRANKCGNEFITIRKSDYKFLGGNE